MQIAIIGGTGDMGFGLGLRLAVAGHTIRIGSRQAAKAEEAAARALALTGLAAGAIGGFDNQTAVSGADLAVVSVPGAAHRATVEGLRDQLAGRPVLDVTVPLAFKPLRYEPPAAGSNAQETAEVLGDGARVAAAFHTVAAGLLADLATPLDVETLVAGNDAELKADVIGLAELIGIKAFDAGALHMAAIAESLTPLLIGLNRRYGSTHIGLRLVGVPE
ncbi:MAG: NADPH-dependent F420 reductase [Bifidobacteriaceae bacterium]|jgi:NADPH-dependent F420 reductase|nr:NADPH-dependent F420 reductase [Bifidobacteriaceae bacterium]